MPGLSPSASPNSTQSLSNKFVIIGAGLAGCECALALARAGLPVTVYEQKPVAFSPAHQSADLGELVCSNSLRSNDATRSGVGLLKQEMRELGSVVMAVAEKHQVPAGQALAVDRAAFAREMTDRVEAEPLIQLIRQPINHLNDEALNQATVILAAGPLISEALAASLMEVLTEQDALPEQAHTEGETTQSAATHKAPAKNLYFYDAIAPIVGADSIDYSIAFRGSRYVENDLDNGDYLNCPMNKEEYETFHAALLAGEKVPAHDFEKEIHFEGCMPIEALAERGARTLTFGPLKPVGFDDPRTGRRPYALVQLRAENTSRSAYNLVGCQTKLTYAAQDSVFRLIPGLRQAEFLRYGSVHRNTYVNAPLCLQPDLSLMMRPNIFLAGQISGVEGYVESAASGLWLGHCLAARAQGRSLETPPPSTALGALLNHLRTAVKHFQPSNAHFGLMPELPERARKNERKAAFAKRAREDFSAWLNRAMHCK